MQSIRTYTASSAARPLRTMLVASFFAAGLGVLFIGGVGFAAMPAVHDAAHDVRHVIGFPCH